jgi:hypothetical protein
MELLSREIALWALNHGYLHLGEYTLLEIMGEDLDVSDEELKQVEKYLDSLMGEEK